MNKRLVRESGPKASLRKMLTGVRKNTVGHNVSKKARIVFALPLNMISVHYHFISSEMIFMKPMSASEDGSHFKWDRNLDGVVLQTESGFKKTKPYKVLQSTARL